LVFKNWARRQIIGATIPLKEPEMTTTIQAAGAADQSKIERYRDAERRLWARYGLDPVERFVQIDSPPVKLRIVEVGSGPAVLFVPGTGGTGPYWAPLVHELSGMRCILVDRPGWGLSSPVDYRGRDFGELTAGILVGMMDALGLDRVDVVGASIGNLWALRLAQRHPARVRRVVNIGGGPTIDLPIPRFIKLLTSPLGAVMVRIPMSPKMVRSQLEAIGHGPSLAAGRLDGFVEWRVAFARETPSMGHERAMARALRAGDGWRPDVVPSEADVAAVERPFLMIFGSADPTGSVDLWRRFVGRLTHGDIRIVDDAGHMPWWDEPEAVGRSVREFLGSNG
jgi:pimeloyl-ACP methyl ester carboxylesterase